MNNQNKNNEQIKDPEKLIKIQTCYMEILAKEAISESYKLFAQLSITSTTIIAIYFTLYGTLYQKIVYIQEISNGLYLLCLRCSLLMLLISLITSITRNYYFNRWHVSLSTSMLSIFNFYILDNTALQKQDKDLFMENNNSSNKLSMNIIPYLEFTALLTFIVGLFFLLLIVFLI